MRKAAYLAAVIVLCAVVHAAASETTVDVTLCAESAGVNTSFFMVFDFGNSNVLAGPGAEVVALASPGEGVQPWVTFDRGTLRVDAGGGKSLVFGRYFHDGARSGNVRGPAVFFQRSGEGEKAIGLAGGAIMAIENGRSRRIGETRHLKVKTPDGERTLRGHRLTSGDGRWIVQIGERVYAVEEEGDLSLLCRAGWRKFETPEGRTLVIVMTRRPDKDSPWTGRFEGRMYRE